MIPSLKLLLCIFVRTACLLGGPIDVAVFLAISRDGVGQGLLAGGMAAVALGVPCGMVISLFFGGWHVHAVGRFGHRLTDETLSVRQRRRLTLELPFSRAFDFCLASVSYLGNAHVEEETDYEAGVIRVTRCWS